MPIWPCQAKNLDLALPSVRDKMKLRTVSYPNCTPTIPTSLNFLIELYIENPVIIIFSPTLEYPQKGRSSAEPKELKWGLGWRGLSDGAERHNFEILGWGLDSLVTL